MSANSVQIALALRMVTDSATVDVPSQLRYDGEDPYAVALLFASGGDRPIEWIFARDLLIDGMLGPSGNGDVRIWPAEIGDRIFVELSSPSGRGVFSADAGVLRDFLDRSIGVVPPGAESIRLDLDSALGLLLGGDSGTAPA